VTKGGKSPTSLHLLEEAAPDTASVADDPDNRLLNLLISEKNGDVLPDENLMEIWIKSATIQDRVLPSGSSTFVVLDFFNFESQVTSLVSGYKPNWEFAANYRITVDDFFLRYFATNVITLELNMVIILLYLYLLFDDFLFVKLDR